MKFCTLLVLFVLSFSSAFANPKVIECSSPFLEKQNDTHFRLEFMRAGQVDVKLRLGRSENASTFDLGSSLDDLENGVVYLIVDLPSKFGRTVKFNFDSSFMMSGALGSVEMAPTEVMMRGKNYDTSVRCEVVEVFGQKKPIKEYRN